MSHSTPSSGPDDIALLRATFCGWTFGSVWITAASGPDRRRLVAIRGEVVLSAWTADDLAAELTAATIAAALRREDDAR
jgi:hypothetical protein